jgi:Zn-finger protein
MDTINKACMYYPCHDKDKLESCVFCYCFRYPCNDISLGKFLENGIWTCENCIWPHQQQRVNNIFEHLKKEFL